MAIYALSPQQRTEDWRRSSEWRNVQYIGQDALVTGEQVYDRPVLTTDTGQRVWTFNDIPLLTFVVSVPPPGLTSNNVVIVKDQFDRFYTVNLLENTLTPVTPVVTDLHFRQFFGENYGRMGNLGGLW
jgi:hypothetical protein